MNARTRRAARCGVWMALALGAASSIPTRLVHAADPPPKTALDPAAISGTVVKLDAGDVLVDIGAKKGAVDGDVLELWRPITVKHPVTGKMLTDRFVIGSIKLTQVGAVMSLGKPQGTLLRPVEPGDIVFLPQPVKVAAPVATPKTGAPTSASTTPPPAKTWEDGANGDPEAVALSALFDGLAGQPVEVRIERYEAWAHAHPSSRFTPTLVEEAQHLRALLAGGNADGAADQPVARSFAPPKEVLAGSSFTLAVEIAGPVVGAVLQLRLANEPAFTPMPMKSTGPGYYSVTVPKERVAGATLSYFIEVVTANGATVPVVASSTKPNEIQVVAAPAVAPLKTYDSTFSLWTDYADYNRLRGNDYAWQTEGYFGMRLGDLGVRAVRSGFGVYKGQGGAVEDLDLKTPPLKPRTVGLSYGYIEGEFGITATFGLIARAVVGLGEEGVTGGGQAFIRLGNDKKTNFMIGGEFLGGVGVRGITQVELNMFPRFPILLRSEVTNQPAGTKPGYGRVQELAGQSVAVSDLGVRAIVQAGYRVTPNLTFFLRGSYQGRTINHAGPGAGAGMTFSW
jgi:hypothetical protein